MMGPLDVQMVGPLVPYVTGFHAELISLGYRPWPAIFQVRFMAHVSWWLESHGLSPHEFTPDRASQFVAARRRAGYVHRLSSHALTRLFDYLRRLQVVPGPPPVVRTAIDRFASASVKYPHRGWISAPKARGWRRQRDRRPLEVAIAERWRLRSRDSTRLGKWPDEGTGAVRVQDQCGRGGEASVK